MNLSRLVIPAITACLAGCGGEQSMFTPAGPEADKVLFLTWSMVLLFTAVFLLVMALTLAAFVAPERWRSLLRDERLVVRMGLMFPIVVLSALLGWGFWLLERAGHAGEPADITIRVEGEQWWWRVTYKLDDGSKLETANEVRIPVGALVELELVSADVLHSFWVPAWAGKMDMIPGRTNVLRFRVETPGTVRGQCAEYCGGAHALMSLYGVAMQPDAFADWLARERSTARPLQVHPGRKVFISTGCGACHQVRGVVEPGGAGPDLTHVGSRLSLGAGLLANDAGAFEAWLAHHPTLKPDNRMPTFEFLTAIERRQLAEYLDALE